MKEKSYIGFLCFFRIEIIMDKKYGKRSHSRYSKNCYAVSKSRGYAAKRMVSHMYKHEISAVKTGNIVK